VRELGVCHPQLGPLTCDEPPILTSIELKGFAERKGQQHESPAAAGLLLDLPVSVPATDEWRYPAAETVKTQQREVGMHLLLHALLLARVAGLLPQSARQLLGEWVQSAWRSTSLNWGSTASAGKYLRIVLRDSLVRRYHPIDGCSHSPT